jgi:ABC-2 type transport system permease protein
MSPLFAITFDEKASFRLMWKMTGRERLFKQTLLPSFGYIIIMIVLPFFTDAGGIKKVAESDKYLFLLYSFLFVAVTLPPALMTGSNLHAAWIFKSVPLVSPAGIFKGFINAAFARFFIPLYLIVSIAVCFIWGIKVLPDTVIALMAIYFFTLLFYFIQQPHFPFSQEKAASSGGAGFIRAFAVIALAVAVGFMHKFLLHWHDYSNLILIPFYLVAILFVNYTLVRNKITWAAVDRVNLY